MGLATEPWRTAQLGIDIGETSVGKYMRRRRRPPSQSWKTFLDNHVTTLVSVGFFTVPTIRFQVLYVFLILAHDCRRILHVGVTADPTVEWTAQQLREAFPWEATPRYLLRDRDGIFGHSFGDQVRAMGMSEVLSTPGSPWQRAYVERVIGTIRRECLWGRPISGLESKYLLSGLGRCGVCGGSMIVRSRSHGKRRISFLACSSYHFRGKTVCANSMEMRLDDADNAVLRALERELLDPEIIETAMQRAIDTARPKQSIESRRASTQKAIDALMVELERLTAAVVGGGNATALVQAIRDREKRLTC